MDLRHKVSLITPNIKEAKEEGTQRVFTQLVKQLNDMFKNVYDDLNRLVPERVSTLPTAADEYLGRFMIEIQASAADKLHVCVYNTNTSAYEWKEITYV